MVTNLFTILFSSLLFINSVFGSYCIETSSNIINNNDSKEFNWYYQYNKESGKVSSPKESPFINNHNVIFVGDNTKKEIFLTFDEGYENGNTGKILDILKNNNVPAAFFVTRPYIVDHPDLIQRMDAENHLVCNHSSHHPSMASITDKNKFEAEFKEVEEEYRRITGKDMPKFFRPPMGKYSDLSLKYTDDLEYITVFWSFAYKDWLINNQPSKEEGKNKIINKVHNGEVMLLHAVSDTNTAILDDIIKELKSKGYEFKPLTELKK